VAIPRDLCTLSARDLQLLDECLRGVLEDRDAFPDEEFSTIMGLDRADYARFVDGWRTTFCTESTAPSWRGSSELAWGMLQNALNNIIGYPHRSAVAPARSEVERLWARVFGAPYGAAP
jgi:hypothetical protein